MCRQLPLVVHWFSFFFIRQAHVILHLCTRLILMHDFCAVCFQMVVAGMAAHSEIQKGHEIANEMRRVNKQLKEAQALAVTYNNRERLFGMPVTNVSYGSLLPRTIYNIDTNSLFYIICFFNLFIFV